MELALVIMSNVERDFDRESTKSGLGVMMIWAWYYLLVGSVGVDINRINSDLRLVCRDSIGETR